MPPAGRPPSGAESQPGGLPVGSGRALAARLLAAAVALAAVPWIAAQTESAQEVFERAERAISESRFAAAAADYRRLVEHSPDLPELRAKLGWIYYQMGSFEDCAETFAGALQVKPQMPTAEALLAICRSELGRFEESVPVLARLFERPPDPSLTRMIGLELQRGYLGLKRFHDAAATALRLSRSFPDDPEILYYTGRLYGDFSFLTMQKLSNLDGESVWAQLAAAEAYETRERFELAIVEYRKVLEVAPHRAGIHFRIGRILRYDLQPRRPLSEAVREFEQELDLDPSNASAAYELGEALRVMGEEERARAYFEQAIRYYPLYEEPRIGLARVLLNSNKPGEAIPHLEKAIGIRQDSEVPHYLLAQAYRQLGDEERSRKALLRFQRLQGRE